MALAGNARRGSLCCVRSAVAMAACEGWAPSGGSCWRSRYEKRQLLLDFSNEIVKVFHGLR